MTYIIVEFLVNLLQSYMVTNFLIKGLGAKNKSEFLVKEYLVGILLTLVYLEILNRIVFFESIGIFTYLIISLIFSAVFLNGSIIEKLFYNFIMLAGIVFASLLGGGIVGVLSGLDYLSAMEFNTVSRYIAIVLVQIVLYVLYWIILKTKTMFNFSNSKYNKAVCVIPLVSVVICCLILYRENQSYTTHVIYTMISIIGIFIVNVVNVVLLTIEHKVYTQAINDKILLNAYKQLESDLDSIKDIKEENSKFRHEINNILTVLKELLDNNKTGEASVFLSEFVSTQKMKNNDIICTDNVILNYLLNRKASQCYEMGIESRYIINGTIEGIQDIDLYILLENLIDNAIEASLKSVSPKIEVNITFIESEINIEISNTIKENCGEITINTSTTKNDKKTHGYGLKNVQDIVQKYEGNIVYKNRGNIYCICKVALKKRPFVPKNDRSCQTY